MTGTKQPRDLPEDIRPEHVRWLLIHEARLIFGPKAAMELAELYGMLRSGDLDKDAA